jgi:hypothetical protein
MSRCRPRRGSRCRPHWSSRSPLRTTTPPQRLVRSLRGTDRQVTIADLHAGQAVRALRPGTPAEPETLLDMHVPVPGSSSHLILSFSTPLTQLAGPMTELFDTIASTLRWIS